MKEILFPHDSIRKTQDVLIEDIMEAVKAKKHFLAHAPTGIGKTAILGPVLSYALKNDLTIFFLTPRHTQHKIAIDTLKMIKNKYNTDFKAVDIIGKKWMCPVGGTDLLSSNEFFEYCKEVKEKDICEYFLNLKNKSKKAFTLKQIQDPLHVEEICKICKDAHLCPYEISIELAKKANVIIADYYHILSPSVRENLLKKTNKNLQDSIIIFDEAQNLPQRTRDLLTTRLSTFIIDAAIKECKNFNYNEYIKDLEKIKKVLELFVRKISITETETLINKQEFISEIEKITNYEELIANLKFTADEIRKDKKRSFLGSIANFLEAWTGEDFGFARILSRGFLKSGKPIISLSYLCLDPSLATKPVIDNSHSVICMSGTLSPALMYRDLLGFQESNTNMAEYNSPFPKQNRLNLIIPETTTKFTARNSDMYQKIATLCAEVVNSIPGNVAVFFPSYQLRDDINKYFQNLCEKTTLFEQPNLNKSEKTEILETFKKYKNQGAVLLGTSTGSFGEGIDLPGDLLKAVIIVGLPLAKPNLETKELINYYNQKFKRGWDYGYIYPAIIKTLQNAGRCIRSETDRGIIIFLDERYVWPNYSKCFPPDFNFKLTKFPKKIITQFFQNHQKDL